MQGEPHRSRRRDTCSWDNAAQGLAGLLDPIDGAGDGGGDALGLEDIAFEEPGSTTGQLRDQLSTIFRVHIEDSGMTAVSADLLYACLAETGCAVCSKMSC